MQTSFRKSINVAVNNANLTGALGRFSEAYRVNRAKAYEGIDFEAVRERIKAVKGSAAGQLDRLAEVFKANAEARGAGTGEMTMINDKVGVMMVAKDGTARIVREGNYWHAASRPDGKVLVIDDMQGRLWLCHAATGEVRLLATGIRDTVRVHAHASFDRRGDYVQFHTGRTHETVALIDLRELPASAWPGPQ